MCRFSSLPILNWAVPYKIEQPQQGMKLQEEKHIGKLIKQGPRMKEATNSRSKDAQVII